MGKGGCAPASVLAAATVSNDKVSLSLGPADEDSPDLSVGRKWLSTPVTSAELSLHTTSGSCWVAYRHPASATATGTDGDGITDPAIVYDVTRWLSTHPGGSQTILNASGRDATAILRAMHSNAVLEMSLRRVRKVGVLCAKAVVHAASTDPTAVATDGIGSASSGRAEDGKLLAEKQTTTIKKEDKENRAAQIEADFLALDERLLAEGFYDYDPARATYLPAVLRCLALLMAGVGLIALGSARNSHCQAPSTPEVDANTAIDTSIHLHNVLPILLLLIGSTLLGLFHQQLAFLGHDAGHNSLSGRRSVDSLLGLVVGNLLAGIDIGWWKSTHNVHHGATNSMVDDPDIQHLPLFCFDVRMMGDEGGRDGNGDKDERGSSSSSSTQSAALWSTYHRRHMDVPGNLGRRLLQYQHWYFYPVMAFARINLYLQSILYVAKICPFGATAGAGVGKTTNSKQGKDNRSNTTKSTWLLQVLSLALFYVLCYSLLASLGLWIEVALVIGGSTAVAGILHVQILLSHVAMDYHRNHISDSPAPSMERNANTIRKDNYDDHDLDDHVGFHELQALTTMDIACPPFMDWAHGGLQFQLEHHLFPRLPKSRLRQIIPLVDEVFARHGIVPVRKGFFQANRMVLKHMAEVGREICKADVSTTRIKTE